MKKWKRIFAVLLAVCCLAAVTPVPAFADEQNGLSEYEMTGEIAPAYLEKIANYLAAYARYDSVSMRSLYQAAIEGVLKEHPELFEEAMKAMLNSIDENSDFFTEEEAAAFRQQLESQICGVGITVSDLGGDLVIGSILPDTPAERAGLQAGDILVSVDALDVTGLALDVALSHVRGEEGTAVNLGIKRSGMDEILYFPVLREQISTPSVKYEVYGEAANKVMYIRLYTFSVDCAKEFDAALDIADREGITNIIIDLRDNGGGVLSQAIEIANNFVPAGNIITTEDYKISQLNRVYKSTNTRRKDYDTIVLINQNSASASEVLTAALCENGVAQSIGVKSYGKGTVQQISNLDNGQAMKYTIAYYLTPEGNNIHKVGITPTATVENEYVSVDVSGYQIFQYNQVYKLGDSGADVRKAKEILDLWGLYKGEINDYFDDALAAAIKAFQSSVGLYSYGELDLTTQISMYNKLQTTQKLVDHQLQTAFDHYGIEVDLEK